MKSRFPNQMPFTASLQQQLHFAAEDGDLAKIHALLTSVEVDTPASDKATALHVASASGQAEAIRLLLARGANPNARDHKQRTPLHWAVARKQVASIEALLQNQADPNLQDKYGNTPLGTCLFSGKIDLDILRTLLEYGADPLHHEMYKMAQERGYKEACALMLPYVQRTQP